MCEHKRARNEHDPQVSSLSVKMSFVETKKGKYTYEEYLTVTVVVAGVGVVVVVVMVV